VREKGWLGKAKAEIPPEKDTGEDSLYRFWSTIVFVGGAADMATTKECFCSSSFFASLDGHTNTPHS